MATQLAFDGMPEPTPNLGTGHLYVCLGDNGTVKIGRTGTAKGLDRRLRDHRKQDPSMQRVCDQLVADVTRLETSLKRILADHGTRIAGTEWYLLNAHTGNLIIEYMEHRGADTTKMRQAFADNIGERTHRLAQ
jgi:hypothetical protein